LALACTFCNRYKGSDIGSIVWDTNTFVRFYNPRTDRWADHFELDGIVIKPRTNISEVTARILEFNNSDRLLEWQTLQPLDGIQVRQHKHACSRTSKGAL